VSAPAAPARDQAEKFRPAATAFAARADNSVEKMIEDFMRSHGCNRLQAILALRLFYLLGGPT